MADINATASLAHEIKGFLEAVKDQGTRIDSGTHLTDGYSELWVTVQGVEYNVRVAPTGKGRT
jgi:hypothetical protein